LSRSLLTGRKKKGGIQGDILGLRHCFLFTCLGRKAVYINSGSGFHGITRVNTEGERNKAIQAGTEGISQNSNPGFRGEGCPPTFRKSTDVNGLGQSKERKLTLRRDERGPAKE